MQSSQRFPPKSMLSTTTNSGYLSIENNDIDVQTKLASTNLSENKVTGITLTPTNAYLNKSATIGSEATDDNHMLLNRSEMDDRYQQKPASATNNNIATFTSRNTVDSGKSFTTTVANAISSASDNKIPTEHAVRVAIEDAVVRAVVYKGTVTAVNSNNILDT